jgi:hypothetical protein
MKLVKSILMFASIIVGILVTSVLVCGVVLMVSPNTEIFGYKYVNYRDLSTRTYANNSVVIDGVTGAEVYSATAISVTTQSVPVTFRVSEQNHVFIRFNPNISGFVKTDNSNFDYHIQVVEKAFPHNTPGATHKTVDIVLTEPEGWLFTGGGFIEVYIPVGFGALEVLSATTTSGSVTYTPTHRVNNGPTLTIQANRFYATTTSGSVFINTPNCSHYTVTTTSGEFRFINPTTVTANVEFTTQTGRLQCSNNQNNATITGSLTINSDAQGSGMHVNVNRVLGTLSITARIGTVNISQIGLSQAQPSTVAISGTSLRLNFGTVYGDITSTNFTGITTAPSTRFDIDKLFATTTAGVVATTFNTGSDSITINELVGNIGFETTSGNVTIRNAKGNIGSAEILSKTRSGHINVTFDRGGVYNFFVESNEGNITAKNLSGLVTINITTMSAADRSRTIDLEFMNVTEGSSINARNYTVNVKTETGLTYRIIASKAINNITGVGVNSLINLGEEGHVADKWSYRIGYAPTDALPPRDIQVTTTGTITIAGIAAPTA